MRLSPETYLSRCLLAVARLFGVLAMLMTVGQTPAVAASVPAPSGTWIVVCGGDGTKLVKVDDETPKNQCSHHCDCCVVSTASIVGLSTLADFGRASGYTTMRFDLSAGITGMSGAEQYWAANRGPPKASKENMMMNSTSLKIKGPVAAASVEGAPT